MAPCFLFILGLVSGRLNIDCLLGNEDAMLGNQQGSWEWGPAQVLYAVFCEVVIIIHHHNFLLIYDLWCMLGRVWASKNPWPYWKSVDSSFEGKMEIHSGRWSVIFICPEKLHGQNPARLDCCAADCCWWWCEAILLRGANERMKKNEKDMPGKWVAIYCYVGPHFARDLS